MDKEIITRWAIECLKTELPETTSEFNRIYSNAAADIAQRFVDKDFDLQAYAEEPAKNLALYVAMWKFLDDAQVELSGEAVDDEISERTRAFSFLFIPIIAQCVGLIRRQDIDIDFIDTTGCDLDTAAIERDIDRIYDEYLQDSFWCFDPMWR